MKSAAEHAREVESAFLAGAQGHLSPAEGKLLAGSWFRREDHDFGERVRATMADRRMYDRERYAVMPHGRGFTIRGYQRRWFFGKRVASVTIATVLAPPGPLLDLEARHGSAADTATEKETGAASEQGVAPVTLADVKARVQEVMKAKDGRVPHLIGICSPSGFEPEVWTGQLEVGNVRLVLVEPRAGGGWRVGSPNDRLDPKLCKLFDPEGTYQKLMRIVGEIQERSADLLLGGISAAGLARQLEVPETLVRQAFEKASEADRELQMSRESGDVLLYRGAATDVEDGSMRLLEWIKGLFSRQGDEVKTINTLSERRASLSSKRDRIYEDVSKLEKREAQLLAEGKAATSGVAKRRLAGQIAQLRKDISRFNTSAAILSKQINIISTHVHNLQLAATGNLAEMPTSEELAEAAASAEAMLEELSANDQLVSGLEVTMAETSMTADEAEILKELEGDKPAEKVGGRETAVTDVGEERGEARKERGKAQAE